MTETARSIDYNGDPAERISDVRQVELRGDIDAALGLSGAAVVGDYLVLGADEGHKLQILARTKDGAGWKLQRNVALATDGLARLFSNPLVPLRLGRNLGLLALALLPGARHPLARAAMGMLGRQPRLSRGVSLD